MDFRSLYLVLSLCWLKAANEKSSSSVFLGFLLRLVDSNEVRLPELVLMISVGFDSLFCILLPPVAVDALSWTRFEKPEPSEQRSSPMADCTEETLERRFVSTTQGAEEMLERRAVSVVVMLTHQNRYASNWIEVNFAVAIK